MNKYTNSWMNHTNKNDFFVSEYIDFFLALSIKPCCANSIKPC